MALIPCRLLTGIVAGAASHVQRSSEGGSKIGQFALHVVRGTGVRCARCLVMVVIVVHRRRIILQQAMHMNIIFI